MSTPPAFDTAYFASITTPQLRALVAASANELKRRESAERTEAVQRIHAIAKELGVSVAELIAQPKKDAIKVPAQYRNPHDASQEWSGRGRQPAWVVAALDQGTPLASLRIHRGETAQHAH